MKRSRGESHRGEESREQGGESLESGTLRAELDSRKEGEEGEVGRQLRARSPVKQPDRVERGGRRRAGLPCWAAGGHQATEASSQ